MNRQRTFIATLLILLAVSSAAVASGGPQRAEVGNLYLVDNGGIFPTKLPRHGRAPVTAWLRGELGTRDGTHPPAARSVELAVDRTIAIDAVGLPSCSAKQLSARSTMDAKRACPEAIVGTGKAEVEVAFPEQAPFSSTGPIVVFNGGVSGRTTTVLLHAYVDVPAPTAIVTTATVTRTSKGRFGLQIAARIPRIAGGSGSLTAFEMKIGRRYTYRGRRKSLLAAGCPTGNWATKGSIEFDDGTYIGLTHVFPCTPVEKG